MQLFFNKLKIINYAVIFIAVFFSPVCFSRNVSINIDGNSVKIQYKEIDDGSWGNGDLNVLRDSARDLRRRGYNGIINIVLPPVNFVLNEPFMLNDVLDGGGINGITVYSGELSGTTISGAGESREYRNYGQYSWPIGVNGFIKNNRYPDSGNYLYVKKWSEEGATASNSHEKFKVHGYIETEFLPDHVTENILNARLVLRKEFAQEILRIKMIVKVNKIWRIFLEWPDGKYSFERSFPRKSTGDAFHIEWNNYSEVLKSKIEDHKNHPLHFPKLENLLLINGGVSNITFENIVFHGTGWNAPNFGFVPSQGFAKGLSNGKLLDVPGAIEINDASNIEFKFCKFMYLGAHAIKSNRSLNYLSVKNCVFSNIAGGGIFIEIDLVPVKIKKTSNINIYNNIFKMIGVRYLDAVGVFAGYVSKINIVGNEFYGLPYSAVSVGWGWEGKDSDLSDNNISFNFFKENVSELTDGADIYVLSNQPRSIIEGNVFIPAPINKNAVFRFRPGIYLDSGARGFILAKNCFYDEWSEGLKKIFVKNSFGNKILDNENFCKNNF